MIDKFVIYSLMIFLLFSCKHEISETSKQINKNDNINRLLDRNLEKQAFRFINKSIELDTSLKNIAFTIEFFSENMYNIFDEKDTFLIVQPLRCDKNLFESKGVIIKDSLTIYIFDKDDVGKKYYTDSLLIIPNGVELKCTTDDTLGGAAFVIKNGKFYKWGP